MKKFFFRLETLLKVRKASETRMQRDTAYADQKLSQWREKEEMLDGQISSLMEEIRQKREQGDHSLQETYAQILDHLEASLVQVRQTITAQEKVIDEHRERLKQAVQERKVIEKIKEKHYSQWQSQVGHNEEVMLEEYAHATHR